MFKSVKNIIIAATLFVPAMQATAADFKLNRYATTPEKWNTNSYWLESDEGIVLIDAQLLIEDAKLWSTMLKATGKPIKGAIITHSHGDHLGGLNTLRQELGDFPIITSKATADTFKAGHEGAIAFTGPVFGDRFDKVLVMPTQTIDGKAEIELAGIKFVIEDIGPGESANATLIYQPDQKILFSGDATMHHSHLYTGEGHVDAFAQQLQHIKTSYKDTEFIYAGHGDPARLTHIDKQLAYIKDIQQAAEKILAAGDYMTEDGSRFKRTALEKHVPEILKKYPGYGDFGFDTTQVVAGNIAGALFELRSKSQTSSSE